MKKYGSSILLCSFASLLLLTACSKNSTFTFTAAEPQPITRTVTMAVVGDIMVHDYQYNEAYDPATGTYDFSHNFTAVKKYLEGYDLCIGNLELTFGGSDRPYSSFPCFNTPDSFLDTVKDAGFDVLTTANNHSMDTGKSGLLRTLDKLDEAGIAHTGTFRSAEEQQTPLIIERNGMTIAFVSCTYGTNGIPVPDAYLINILGETDMTALIEKAEKMADLVVVLPHMGNEYETYVRPVFEEWADSFFAAGADIVLASHPHVLQPMQYRKIVDEDGSERDGFIIYSLGNFISSQTTPPRNASIILHLTVEQAGDQQPTVKSVSFVPIWTQFRNAQDENHFMVRGVYDMLTLPEAERYRVLRPKDYNRLLEVHDETASFLLRKNIPLSEMQEEYDFPKDPAYYVLP